MSETEARLDRLERQVRRLRGPSGPTRTFEGAISAEMKKRGLPEGNPPG